MRFLLTTAFLFAVMGTVASYAQTVIIDEGFDDGDFTNNPSWADPEAKHFVDGLNVLRLDAPAVTDEAVISTPSDAAYGEWEAFIELDFNPSGSNLAKFYVLSDTQNIKDSVEGYYIIIGDTEEEISLYRQDGTSETKIIDGTDGLIDSNPVNVRVRVTRDIDGNWELFADASGGTAYTSQGTVTDNTYGISNFIGFLSDYTSTRSDLFAYDDILITKVNPPLGIQDITLQDNSTIDVQFNLDIDPASVSAADFSLDNGAGNPDAASLSSSNVVRLSYNSPLPSNQYTLTISNIDDSDGNTIAPNTSGSFNLFGTFINGDVIINEFMYDPPSGQAEYVELKNRSDKFLNLQNWQIGDDSNNGTISTDTLVLRPNDFLVISSDTAALFNVYGARPYAESGSIPALNNGGDVVQVLTAAGSQVDSLRYASEWGGDNVALERRSDTAPSVFMENFGDSPNPLGGTPGIANEVADDTTPPNLNDLVITNNQTLDLNFSERLDNSTASSTGNYSLDNGISIDSAKQTTGDSVRLSLDAPLQNGTEYQLSITNQQDIFGNTTGSIDTTFNFFEVTTADSGDIFVNEFMYDPPEESSEYIELSNPTDESFDLNGWTINDNTGNRRTITERPFIVPPDSFVIIAPNNTLLQENPATALVNMGNNFPSLNNSGDDIVLRDASGERLDSLQYTPAFGGDEIALERRTTDVAPIRANFGDAPNGFGTPGRQNEIPPDTTPPDLAGFSIIGNQALEFVFTEQLENQSATNADNYSLSGGISIHSATLAGDTVRVNLSDPLQNNTEYTTAINGVDDLFGNTLTNRDTTFTFFEVSPADSGKIFINEFTYDPPEGSIEYIELINPTDESFDLNGWTINDNTGNRRTITNGRFIVPPDSLVVIAPDNTLLENISDIALVNMGNSFPSLNNSGDQIVVRDSTGLPLDSLQYTGEWGGNGIALERRTTAVSPIQPNFGDAPNGFGTPGAANEIPPDNTPPDIAGFTIHGNQSLEFVFTETVDPQTASEASNYVINKGISVASATLTGDTAVRLALSDPLQNNTRYTASVRSLTDIFGNTRTNIDTTFTYFDISQADSGDIFVNEFLYEPPSGQAEYIELFNPTPRSLNLQNWTINDNTGNRQTITDEQLIIPPDGFVVISSDQTLLEDFPGIAMVTMGSRFPSLNNSGDDIVLRDQGGQLLDSLRYTSGWGGDEIALERRITSIPPLEANFGDSPSGFGTPGAANSIAPDEQPPVLNNIQILDNTTLKLTFSEGLTAETTTDEDNYSINPNRNIQLISSVEDTVTLFLSQELESEQAYELTISGLQDIFGNTLEESSREITFVAFSDAQPGDIVINEILYSRSGAGGPEFVELFNRTGQNFDLSGWQIGDASNAATIDSGTRLPAGDYLVITENAALANTLENSLFLSDLPSLNDDEDAVYIQTDEGQTIDSLFYNANFGGNLDGTSAERIDPAGASNDASNFATSTADAGSTPGAKNAVFMRDETSPSIVFSRLFPNGDIEVRFSEFISVTPDLTFTLDGETVNVDSFDPDNANVIFLNTPSGTTPGSDQTITAQNLSDVSGNVTASTQLSVAQSLNPGDVVINEILFDPLSDSDDNQPDQAEYLELRNIRDYAISLENITLHDAADEDGEVRTLTPVSTNSKFISAQGTALIYAEDETPAFDESKVAQFFDIQSPALNAILQVDRSSLSLASTDDAIYLTGGDGASIDSVFYDEGWHNPNLIDTDGIALERINPFGPSNDDSNWGSSTAEEGGTPNRENTLFQTTENGGQDEVGISFSTNPFSPDGDGTEDNLLINYQLDESDYLITVRIYDRYGRLVRELADGRQAGFTGTLTWDGLKDDGTRNRIGIYIIIFKAFDSAGGDSQTFKETVVLARRLN